MNDESTAVAVPVPGDVPLEVQKAVTEAYGTLVEQVRKHEDYFQQQNKNAPKAWFADPFQLLDSLGMGYRQSPIYLTYDTLRIVTERDTIASAIILTRVNQVAAFSRPQINKYSVGFKIRPRGPDKLRRLTDSEREKVTEIEHFLLDTGRDSNPARDSFEQFLRKTTRDSLTYDQMCFEKVKTWGGEMHSFFAVPSDTIRIAHPAVQKGTPTEIADLKRQIKFIQLINAQIVNEYTHDEMAFLVRNPRTNVRVYGYGLPEIETLMTTVTSHMWAEEWNRRAFSQGSTIKGVLNLKGNIPPVQFETFKRQWTAQVSGITNAWKTPVVNTEGAEWLPLQLSNTEMGYQMWMEYLVKIACAIYQIDPAEINFDLRGSAGQQPIFMSNTEAQQKVSKDRGLQPLLRFLEDSLNRHVVSQIDPRFELSFLGLDAKTEEQAIQLRMQQVQNVLTLNEVRALEDLPPVKEGDIVLNPTYTGYLTQKAMQAQQSQMMGMGAGGPPAGEPPPGGMGGGGPTPPGLSTGGPPGAPKGGAPTPAPGGKALSTEEEEEPKNEPYAGQFDAQSGSEERDGAEALRDVAKPKMAPKTSEHEGEKEEESSGSEVDSSTLRRLHIDDWSSSHRASHKLEDLAKSGVELYDTVDLGD